MSAEVEHFMVGDYENDWCGGCGEMWPCAARSAQEAAREMREPSL